MNRRAFSFLDILVSIGAVSLLCMGLLKMSLAAQTSSVQAAAADAMLRELANFSNVFGRCDSFSEARPGSAKRSLTLTGNGLESAAFLESGLAVRKDGGIAEFTLNVLYAPSESARGKGFSRAVSVRRIAE